MTNPNDIDLDRLRSSVQQLMRVCQLLLARHGYGQELDAGPASAGPVRVMGLSPHNLERGSFFLHNKVIRERLDVDFEDKIRAIECVSSSLEQVSSIPLGMLQATDHAVTSESFLSYLNVAYQAFLEAQINTSKSINELISLSVDKSKSYRA